MSLSDTVIFYAMTLTVAAFYFFVPPLYDDYRGLNDTYYAGADGHSIVLQNNKTAVNPTYAQAIQFISQDNTDKIPYTDSFQCGDYAEKVHDNAEAAGYKCGWVAIHFADGTVDHSCNVFNTTDKGLVFVDCVRGDKIAHPEQDNCCWFDAKPFGSSEWDSLGIVSSYYIWW